MNQQVFQKMNKKEKESFLSNDLTERIIRIEQRVSARFGRLVPYHDTEYYKSLSSCQREKFEKYLKNKKKKKLYISAIFLLPILALFLINANFTGNIVKENFGEYVVLDYAVFFFILIFIIAILISWSYRKSRNKKYENHFKLLENIHYSRNI